jgi:PAS domain S-box-containing protein
MVRGDGGGFSLDISGEIHPDAGIYTWDIERNLVFADQALAELFGLDPEQTARGLPLETYLDRVHPGDKASLAKVIGQTIAADIPQQLEYRVRDSNGQYRLVTAFGRAFRDRSDNPILYSGIVVPSETLGRPVTDGHSR